MASNEWWEQPLSWFEPDCRNETEEELDDKSYQLYQETHDAEEDDEYSA